MCFLSIVSTLHCLKLGYFCDYNLRKISKNKARCFRLGLWTADCKLLKNNCFFQKSTNGTMYVTEDFSRKVRKHRQVVYYYYYTRQVVYYYYYTRYCSLLLILYQVGNLLLLLYQVHYYSTTVICFQRRVPIICYYIEKST